MLQKSTKFSRLKLYCEAPYTKECVFSVNFFDTVLKKDYLYALIPSNKAVYFTLPSSEYRLKIRNNAGLDLASITKWVNLKKCSKTGLYIIFERSQRIIPTVTVDIKVTDANYPNIIQINGGITVCQ